MLWLNEELTNLEKAGNLRSLKNFEGLIDFGNNDYLGISKLENLQTKFLQNIIDQKDYVLASTGARLLSGNKKCFNQTENLISSFYPNKSCLIYTSGFATNTGVLPTLAKKTDLIVCDKLAHASIIDAIKLSEASFARYAHNNYEHLEKILKDKRDSFDNVFIATESVFSMDGDKCDIEKLIELKNKYKCLLYIDEAHAFGIYGKNGLGFSQEYLDEVDFIICTLSKAFSSVGGFVLAKENIKKYLINKSRSFIFTTANAPINILWTKFLFENLDLLNNQRQKLITNTLLFRNALKDEAKNIKLLGQTQICPLVLGENKLAINLSNHLLKEGFYAPAIKHPTVPKNEARIRFSINASLSENDITKMTSLVKTFIKNENIAF